MNTVFSNLITVRLPQKARLSLLTALALAVVWLPTRSFAQAPTFNTLITTYKGGPNWAHPLFAAVGDFNGDGKLDALISDGQTSLRLLLGNGDGTFTEHDIDVNPAGLNPPPGPIEIKAADFNGDGKLDAVFVSPQGNLAPTVLINTGNDGNGVPQFTVTTYTPVYGGLRSVTVGDLNGDGKPDFIAGSAYGYLQVYLNNGDGTFTAGQSMSILQPNPNGSVGLGVIADLNGDLKADYVVTDNQSGATDIFWGNGDGTFQTAPLTLPNNANSIAVADVSGDGKLDLLAVENGSPNQLVVYVNTSVGSVGSFSAPTRYPTGGTQWNGWTAVATADMNGDGKQDVVVANSGSNNVAVLLGDGSGTFGAPALFTVNLTPLDLAVGDFNGDGNLDIATVGSNDDTFGVLLNTTPSQTPVLFSDPLTGPTSPNLTIPFAKYTYEPSGLERTQSDSPIDGNTDRPMVKTVSGGYLQLNQFTATLTVNEVNDDLTYFGFGQGITDPSYDNEPSRAFVFRIHNNFQGQYPIQEDVLNAGGHYLAINVAGNATYPGGPLTFVISRNGDSLSMSVPSLNVSQTYSVSQYATQLGLTNSNTYFFFGNTSFGTVFSNFNVSVQIPSTTTVSCPASTPYTGSALTSCTATVTAADGFSQTVAVTYTNNTNAGTAAASASFAGGATHTASSGSGSFTITPATSSVGVNCPISVVYNGLAQTGCTATATTSDNLTVPLSPVNYSNNTNVGTATASASYAGDANHAGSSNSTTFSITPAPSTTTVTCTAGPFIYNGSAQTPCSATMTEIGAPNQSVPVTYGSNVNAGPATASASYAGDNNHTGSSGSASFTIAPASTATSISANPYAAAGTPVALTATVTVTVGGGSPAGLVTFKDGNIVIGSANVSGGQATLNISSLAIGPHSITASYAGNSNFVGSASGAASVLIYAYPASGAFVIGNVNAAPGGQVTFWGAQWAKLNSLSGGSTVSAFKGFADSAGSTTWTSNPGSSSNPPAVIPAYMAVLVTSSMSKSGSAIGGNVSKIVIVQTNSGYGPDPGQPGTGSIIATIKP